MEREIGPDHQSRLLAWLRAANGGIRLVPLGTDVLSNAYAVEVHNGRQEPDYMGTIIARCSSELEAELVATALWALLKEN